MNRDIVRTLRTQAQLFRQMKNPAQGDILDRAAEEMEGLRAELAALKAAARPVAKSYLDAKNNQIWSGANVTGETMALPGVTVAELDELARLCGEG